MERGRARDLGVVIGTYPPGPRNAVTDVEGVRVGHRTIVRDPSPGGVGAVRTGVTTVFPHEGLPWIERVYAGTDILNGFGDLVGPDQLPEPVQDVGPRVDAFDPRQALVREHRRHAGADGAHPVG